MNLTTIIASRMHKVIYRDGDTVVKLFDSDYSKVDVLNEALNQARAEEAGLQIPELREVTKTGGKWALVSDYIEGKSMSTLLEKHPEKIDEYMDTFVRLQIEIHSKTSPLLTKLSDKMKRKIDMAGLSATARYALHARLEALARHSKLCHGDFTFDNVIITNEGLPYVIDWAHATQGCEAADAARTYMMLLLKGQDKFAQLYIRMFTEKTEIPLRHIEKWLPITAASQSVKNIPGEKKMLIKWTNSIDMKGVD